MYKREYQEKKKALMEEMRAVQEKMLSLDDSYAKECMERSGYKVGAVLSKEGREGIIVGAVITNGMPQLDVRKINKEGTPSQMRNTFLCNYLKEV